MLAYLIMRDVSTGTRSFAVNNFLDSPEMGFVLFVWHIHPFDSPQQLLHIFLVAIGTPMPDQI